MAMSSAYWLVAGRRNGLAVLAGPRTVAHRAGDVDIPGSCSHALAWVSNYWGPNTSFIFLVASLSLITVPYWLFVPKRRSQRDVVGSRAVMTLSLLPFIGPTSSLLANYIPRDQYVTSGVGYLVPSYMHFRH